MRRARHPDEQGHVDNNGVRIFYEVYEHDGPTVLLMPPVAFAHSRVWKGQIPYLSRHFRVLTFDGRGNGKTDRPTHPAEYGPEQFAADALAVMDHTATAEAIAAVLGPRSIAAVRMAVDHPQRVAGLALLAPDLFAEREFADAWRVADDEPHTGFGAFNPHLMRSDWPRFLGEWSRVMFPRPHSSRQIEDLIAYGLETNGETFVASTIGNRYPPQDEVLEMAHRLRCPCVVTQWGVPMWPARTSEIFARAAGAPLVVFESLGPMVSVRWPVAVNLLLREFAESIRDERDPDYERWNGPIAVGVARPRRAAGLNTTERRRETDDCREPR
jgi:pimeloyl-ACP methyl ester carboxylesterase